MAIQGYGDQKCPQCDSNQQPQYMSWPCITPNSRCLNPLSHHDQDILWQFTCSNSSPLLTAYIFWNVTFSDIWQFTSSGIYLLTCHIAWQITSPDRSYPLTVNIQWQFTFSDSSHPMTVHIIWQFTFSDSSHPMTVHILWQFTLSDSSHSLIVPIL